MKNNLGLGVMINMLSGNAKSVEAFTSGINKKIKNVSMKDDQLHIMFEDGTGIGILDNGQSCCESRYMTTNADLPYYSGSILLDAEVVDAPSRGEDNEFEEHDVQFLNIKTSKGVFTCETHNEHNGYYGGFSIECSKIGDS